MRRTIILFVSLVLTAHVSTSAFAARGRGGTVRTEHNDNQKDVTGPVTAVNAGKREIVVNGQTFNVPGYAPVTINGARGMLMQINVGDRASVRYTIHTTTTIRSKGGGGRRAGKSGSGSRSSKDTNTGKNDSIVAEGVTITR